MLFNSLEAKVFKAQNDPQLLEKLIAAHQGFIKKCMIDQQKASGAPFEDETTVAMLAFAEAVKHYDSSKGKFLSFANLVIKRRLIDAYRQSLKQSPPLQYSLDDSEHSEAQAQTSAEALASVRHFEEQVRQSDLQMEIVLYETALSEFGLSFAELAEISPKQEGLRNTYLQVAKWLVAQERLMAALYKERKMPISEILSVFNIDRKKLERGRKYILAMVILLDSDLELIKQYLERR